MAIIARLYRCFCIALPCVLASCATMRAGSDYYPAADFSGYRTYVWMAESPLIQSQSSRVQISALSVRRIREAIERELAARNFARVATREEADFAIAFTVGARDSIRVEDYPPYYQGSWRWGSPYYWPNVDVAMYTEGMLAIDVFNNETREPVWHGWAQKRIVRSDIEEPGPTIDAAVAAILANFPPTGRQ